MRQYLLGQLACHQIRLFMNGVPMGFPDLALESLQAPKKAARTHKVSFLRFKKICFLVFGSNPVKRCVYTVRQPFMATMLSKIAILAKTTTLAKAASRAKAAM